MAGKISNDAGGFDASLKRKFLLDEVKRKWPLLMLAALLGAVSGSAMVFNGVTTYVLPETSLTIGQQQIQVPELVLLPRRAGGPPPLLGWAGIALTFVGPMLPLLIGVWQDSRREPTFEDHRSGLRSLLKANKDRMSREDYERLEVYFNGWVTGIPRTEITKFLEEMQEAVERHRKRQDDQS